MRFHSTVSAVAAIVLLTATSFQFGATPSADAHVGGFVTKGGHHFKTPPAIKAVPVDNVRDFGATGNGVIDDSTAIQNAANDAAGRGIGVFFPPGTYLHASPLEFSTPVSGSGAASVLIANNPANCAVILTGVGPSIQNMVISTQGLAGASSLLNPRSTTLLFQTATSFTAANLTIVTGTNMWAVLVLQSTVGSINSVAFDGTGSSNDQGVVIDQGDNITVSNSLFQNLATGVDVSEVGGPSQFIAVVSNTIGDVAFPISFFGVSASGVSVLDISQNTIQMLNSSNPLPVDLTFCNDLAVIGNDTWGGLQGVVISNTGSGTNFVTQNTIHNCGAYGIIVNNLPTSAIQVTSNAFGECGLILPATVILVEGGVGADLSGANTFVQNNFYAGHTNNLFLYVNSLFTAPHIPASHVTGNTQAQTTLSNVI
jgi:hypothetical protein